MIKVAAPTMACQVIDWAMQAHGGAGVSEGTPLAHMYASARTIRFADGPDEVHRNQIPGKLELEQYLTQGGSTVSAAGALAARHAAAPVGARERTCTAASGSLRAAVSSTSRS